MQTSKEKGNHVTVDWRPQAQVIQRLCTPPSYSAQPEDIATFQKEGVVLIPGVFTDWVDRREMRRIAFSGHSITGFSNTP